jgi:tripartite-type tricarboxylate transporter receptor subunit TctC
MKRLLPAISLAIMVAVIGPLRMTCAHAADVAFPSAHPINMVIGFTPGGSVDLTARLVSDAASKTLGQKMLVEYKTGAAGNIAAAQVARDAPDGYNLLLATSNNAASPFLYKSLGYDPAKDLDPVARWITTSYFLVVPASLPVHNVPELVAYAKANPGKLNYGSTGVGSPPHLAATLLSLKAGIDMVHVPFRGGPEEMAALLQGSVQLTFAPIIVALPQMKAGTVRAIGVSSLRRSALAPDLPTIAEQGFPGFQIVTWYGAMAPAGTPLPVRQQLGEAMRKALDDPQVRERLAQQGMEPAWMGPQRFGEFFGREMNMYGELTKQAEIPKQ